MKVLFVEDDPGIGRAIVRGLAAEGYMVEWARAATEARSALAGHASKGQAFAVVVLDLGLPDGDGVELCRRMRADGDQTPILMLTARDGLADKLDGFGAGADDYLTKPFAFEELLARLKVLGRRGLDLQEHSLALGPFKVDLRARRAHHKGVDVAMTGREIDVLACLARRAGEVVSRREILDLAWGKEASLTENAVDVYIGYLRRRLAALDGAPRIETVRGVGFRLERARAGDPK
jgi:DNA-binding response OmpR family regulator